MKLTFEPPKSTRAAAVSALVICGVFASGWVFARAAGSLSSSEARLLLQRVFGAELKSDQIRIKSIKPGAAGENVIVEAQIETAFRFTRAGRDWRIAEVRLGDRQWESMDLIDEAIKRERARRTVGLLEKVAEGIEGYRRARGGYVVADSFTKLLDEIAPRYLSPIVEFDRWGTPLSYQGSATRYRLSSAGPDRLPGTGDDLIMENGVLKTETD
jgi:hypothetical protein